MKEEIEKIRSAEYLSGSEKVDYVIAEYEKQLSQYKQELLEKIEERIAKLKESIRPQQEEFDRLANRYYGSNGWETDLMTGKEIEGLRLLENSQSQSMLIGALREIEDFKSLIEKDKEEV